MNRAVWPSAGLVALAAAFAIAGLESLAAGFTIGGVSASWSTIAQARRANLEDSDDPPA